jgi:hypothetical protein
MVHFLSRPKNQDTKAKWTEHLSKAKEKTRKFILDYCLAAGAK